MLLSPYIEGAQSVFIEWMNGMWRGWGYEKGEVGLEASLGERPYCPAHKTREKMSLLLTFSPSIRIQGWKLRVVVVGGGTRGRESTLLRSLFSLPSPERNQLSLATSKGSKVCVGVFTNYRSQSSAPLGFRSSHDLCNFSFI